MASAERFGLMVRRARAAVGMTQDDLAVWVGVSASTVSKIERGRTLPTGLTLGRLSIALGLDAGAVLASAVQGPTDRLTRFGELARAARVARSSNPRQAKTDRPRLMRL